MRNAEALRDRLQPFASECELARNEHLFRQGDPIATVFEVLAGRLRLVRRTIDDHLVVLHTARAGELFAESTLFADTYHCDGVAAVPSRVRTYPKREFIAALRATPDAWEQLAARLAHDLQRLRTQMELRNVRSARERVLQYLWLNAGATERTADRPARPARAGRACRVAAARSPPPAVPARIAAPSFASSAPASRSRPRLTPRPHSGFALSWWRILPPARTGAGGWLIAQPEVGGAFHLFPHL
jgi:CRP-like cAMP-binding protein